MRYYEDHKRSLIKAISYRLLIVASTAVTVFTFTQSPSLTIGVTGITGILNTLLYYIHERLWDSVNWGRRKA